MYHAYLSNPLSFHFTHCSTLIQSFPLCYTNCIHKSLKNTLCKSDGIFGMKMSIGHDSNDTASHKSVGCPNDRNFSNLTHKIEDHKVIHHQYKSLGVLCNFYKSFKVFANDL